MNNGITVKELLAFCRKQLEKGNGDKTIYITSDDEGNAYHTLYYQFQDDEKEIQECIDYDLIPHLNHDVKDIVLLG